MARKYDVPAWKQLHLVRLALRHGETTKADVAVLAEIVQRYHGAHGNGWASYELLMETTGFSRAAIKRSRKKLERLEFVTVLSNGVRGRATVYLPNFDMVPEKGATGDPLSNGFSDEPLNEGLGVKAEPTIDSYGVSDEPTSYIQSPAYKAEGQDRDNDIATATPPLSSGLQADDAGRAIDGFDELYKIYDYRRNRAEAKAGYQAINPDAGLHAEITASALVWRERWAAQNKPDAPRYTLAKWLERECYLEDPPAGYAKQKPEAKPKQKTGAPKMNTGSNASARLYKIATAGIEKEKSETYLIMSLINDEGYFEDFSMLIDADNPSRKEEGQKYLRQLCDACGIPDAQDTSELFGLSFKMNGDGECFPIAN